MVDPVLRRFRDAVTNIYGARAARVVLFGSRARGEGRPDSDYDIAVFLRDMPDRFAEVRRLADVGAAILYDTGEAIADYESGPGAHIKAEAARAALETARRFVSCVASLLPEKATRSRADGQTKASEPRFVP